MPGCAAGRHRPNKHTCGQVCLFGLKRFDLHRTLKSATNRFFSDEIGIPTDCVGGSTRFHRFTIAFYSLQISSHRTSQQRGGMPCFLTSFERTLSRLYAPQPPAAAAPLLSLHPKIQQILDIFNKISLKLFTFLFKYAIIMTQGGNNLDNRGLIYI